MLANAIVIIPFVAELMIMLNPAASCTLLTTNIFLGAQPSGLGGNPYSLPLVALSTKLSYTMICDSSNVNLTEPYEPVSYLAIWM